MLTRCIVLLPGHLLRYMLSHSAVTRHRPRMRGYRWDVGSYGHPYCESCYRLTACSPDCLFARLLHSACCCVQERDAEKGRVDAERLASERAFYSELQVQEADAKSGGQKGLNPHRKKKK